MQFENDKRPIGFVPRGIQPPLPAILAVYRARDDGDYDIVAVLHTEMDASRYIEAVDIALAIDQMLEEDELLTLRTFDYNPPEVWCPHKRCPND